ncbi:D-Ala-D-Ala carboxypeptidase family metallohydrolase [Sphingomicrobium lutaoense]|uniref:Peptidase M15A C-terminal domain-containing protein n=1 Tax=Sphingomicrobium lutaoense TaxID=515949 RepID=A0A839Z432_9SPHN|nr:D-Ala-D-Ala carboxypeptidase family metallohydrolase [Sphingomicrobium lutaoense]MBB3764345.1 hypothetical protein [Sphingomicrobium lutaoense]
MFMALAMLAAASETDKKVETDWGIRLVGRPEYVDPALAPIPAAFDLGAVASLGGQYGRVTSLRRSPEHNRRVGGVPNSHHIRGRAIDIARRAGVTHGQIDAAYRRAGYRLIESLDEGDHSHFAFGDPLAPRPSVQIVGGNEPTKWRIITPPSSGR